MFSLISFASLMTLVLLLKLYSTCFVFFNLISFANKFPVCVSQSFNKVASRVRGLSYSNASGGRTLNFIGDPLGHQSPSALASGEKTRRKSVAGVLY